MTPVSIRATTVESFRAIALQNEAVRAVIIPSLGGRVWELHDRQRDRQWIWHRDDVPLAVAPMGAPYDDVWAGGWEELFPNDAPGVFEGRTLPDHGEWWTLDWHAEDRSTPSEAVLHLTAHTTSRRAACTKEFRLATDASALVVRYRIRSLEAEPFHFLFKQHLPVAVTPQCRLRAAGGRVLAVDPAFSRLLPAPGPFSWPEATANGRSVDLQQVPPRESQTQEFVYIDNLLGDWCGVDDLQRAAALRMRVRVSEFPFLWFFLSYGGWRRVYTAVLEPCTNVPKDLGEAVARGQAACLRPGEAFTAEVQVVLGPASV